jgi:hypothetical protein
MMGDHPIAVMLDLVQPIGSYGGQWQAGREGWGASWYSKAGRR